jgi:hypothetical protein
VGERRGFFDVSWLKLGTEAGERLTWLLLLLLLGTAGEGGHLVLCRVHVHGDLSQQLITGGLDRRDKAGYRWLVTRILG